MLFNSKKLKNKEESSTGTSKSGSRNILAVSSPASGEETSLDDTRVASPHGSTNKFNLNLDSRDIKDDFGFSGGSIQPLVSPGYDEMPIWNILPSYQLYESTFSKNITPTVEDLRHNPPNYEYDSPPAHASDSNGVSFDYFTGNITSTLRVPPHEIPNQWENSILGNTQRMKRLDDVNPKANSHLKVEIHVTEGPCSKGVPSKSIDIGSYEYQQGDTINGYVLLENESDTPLSFDMFSVVFEGKVTVIGDATDAKRPVVFYKFLNMFDYYASWTPANMSDKDILEVDNIDPVDGSRLRLPNEKVFKPHVLYKKFFNFKLPERLLDCACTHNLIRHCEILPSIGLARDQFMQEIRKLRQPNVSTRQKGITDFSIGPSKPGNQSQKKKPNSTFGERVKDLSFFDTAISYSVEARIIGRSSQFSQVPKTDYADEFIIMKESSCFVRVIPRERITYEVELEALDAESRLIYRNLVDRINEKIRLGNEILNKTDGTSEVSEKLDRTLSITKRRQLYTTGKPKPISALPLSTQPADCYSMAVPLKKKQTIASVPKVVGLLEMTSPKIDYRVKYVPAFKFYKREGDTSINTNIEVPIELLYTPSRDSPKPPEIKSVSSEIIVFTYRSRKYPVPIEITPDLIYKNIFGPNDDFEHNVCQTFKKYLADITSMTKKLDHEILGVDSQLIMDMKALANLSCKYHHLKVDDLKISNEKSLANWNFNKEFKKNNNEGQFNKTINLTMDLKPLLSKESTNSNEDFLKGFLTLVPNFQNCITGRFYFLHIVVKFHNHESVSLKIPFVIQL